jgi:hypothetical protein
MTDHEQYDILCALAATKQLTASGRTDFEDHLLHCRACQNQVHDLTSVCIRLRFEAALHPKMASMPAGSVERFRARALQEGLLPSDAAVRRSSSYALVSAAAIFVILSSLLVMPHERKAAESFSADASIPIRQTLPPSVNPATLPLRASKVARAVVVRHHVVRHADSGAEDTSQAAQRFLQTIPPRFPFFGPQSVIKSSRTSYPALSGSQISRLDLFRDLDHAQDQTAEGLAAHRRPIDMASTGNVFDFAANIRQLHFQPPTAQ